MSATTLGIPLNFGLYHGFKNDNTVSLFLNCMPENCMFKYSKTNTLNNMSELEKYDTSSLPTGHTIYIVDSDPTKRGLQTNQFMWDANNKEWISIGNPIIQNVLNIYAVYPDQANDDAVFTQYFMRCHIRNIQANIRLMGVLGGNYIVSNLEMTSFLSLNGEYSLNNSLTNNILTNILTINLRYGVATIMKRICDKYNIPYKDFGDLQNSVVNCTDKIFFEAKEKFIQIVRKYYNIDLSMFTTYMAAGFADMKNILIATYDGDTNIPAINPLNSLKDNDSYLLNRLNANRQMFNSYYEIGELIDYYLYQVNDLPEWNTRYDYLIRLKEVMEYFFENDPSFRDRRDRRNSLIIDLCEGIGGIVNLALLFSIISNSGASTSTLYFHFIASKKYDSIY